MPADACRARLVTDSNMSEGELVSIAYGDAVVYSAAAPDKAGANEDAAALIPVDDQRGVLVVADGVGGQPAGQSAAKIAVDSLKSSVARAAAADEPLRAAILDAVEEANRRVIELATGAATTLAVVEIDGPALRAYHVGDSAILVVGQHGKVKLQTVAHSPVGYAVESGLLDEAEAMHHEERHLISNAVGDKEMRIELGSRRRLAARDTVLLATDGLFDNLEPAEIMNMIRTKPLTTVSNLLAATCAERMRGPVGGRPSKPDDVTFILFRPNPPKRR